MKTFKHFMAEIHGQAHKPHEIPVGDLKKLAQKATKRVDTDVDGDTDNNDKAKGELGEFIPGVGNKRLYSTTGTKTASEAYDAEVMGRSQIRKQGEGGRVGSERKKSPEEMRRTRAVGGGKTEPIEPYKPRSDIGSQRQRSTREQQPTQERGSAALSPKEQQRKAYQERKARESGSPTSSRDKEKEASKLLSTKKEKPVSPDYTPQKASGMTRAERDKARNASRTELFNQKKAKAFADYKEVHGHNPTGKEKTKLLGLIHSQMK